ncbi:hypothetical protein JTE90_006225 [Oedothorax gibbosus]|uniref:GA-binding protein subunit beta-1 n=1 Tax=Oedothorax gibbosus TaxID=931172 RepID=A0AAV6VVZ6_9ARAC|nr:hypothetical protein JTE90_006225 [Oedothorax gibbosus]
MSLVDLGKRLLECAKIGETEEVRILMTNGAPFTTDWLGTSPLHMAAQYGHVTTADVLLRGGISRDARTKVDRTPLHVAAQEGHLEIVQLLVSHGAEIDARDMLRMTPLHWAVDRGHYQVVKFLLKNKADVHAVSKFDKLPLDIAGDNQHLPIIELLTRHTLENQPVKQQYQPKTKVIQVVPPPKTPPQTVKKSVPLYLKSDKLSTISPAIRRTVPHTIQSTTPLITVNSPIFTGSISGSAVKTPATPKQVFLRANLASLQKAAAATTNTASSSDSEEGESNDPGSTNVLATLAALAEATAPNATISTSDALHWLEMNGIAMLPTDNSTIVASALEGGQTVALTEAGKLALTWVKEHQNINNNSSQISSSQGQNINIVTSSGSPATNQKLITIVADQSHIPSITSSPQTPIVILNSSSTADSVPPSKKMKLLQVKKEKGELSNGKSTCKNVPLESEERIKLKEELERFKKQAELYKAQLLQKEHEAEEYKKQLEKIKQDDAPKCQESS